MEMFGKNLTARWSKQPHPETKQNLIKEAIFITYIDFRINLTGFGEGSGLLAW